MTNQFPASSVGDIGHIQTMQGNQLADLAYDQQ